MAAIFYLLMFAAQSTLVLSGLPAIQKCKLSDTACLKTSAQSAVPTLVEGIPELGIERLDTMTVDKITVDLAGLKLNVKDVDVTGLKKAVIDKISLDMDKKQLQLVYHCDLVLKGKYKASGQLLVLPISGDGDVILKIKNLLVDLTMPFEVKKNKDGEDVIELKSYKYKYDVKDNTHFHLTNLFNGNKALSDAMLKFMNENWKVLTKEFGTPMMSKPVEKIYKAIKTYLRSQPLKDIANV